MRSPLSPLGTLRHRHAREQHRERRAFPGLALHENDGAELAQDSEHRGQAKATTGELGGEKRIEDVIQGLRGNPAPVVP